ncbi:MAG: ATP-binding protein [Planctomycetota bacterium]|nr:ATP-binding protein [Planctomycetota bacterium]
MTRTPSIRAKLLTGLIASLTFVLAVGCVGLYWSQRQTLRGEFDRRLDQDSFAARRAMVPMPGSASSQPSAGMLPAGVMFVAEVNAADGRIERPVPADLDLRGISLEAPAMSDSPEFRTARMASGVEVRLVLRRMGPPPHGQGPRRPGGEEKGGPPPEFLGDENWLMDPPPGPETRPGPGPRPDDRDTLRPPWDRHPGEQVLVAGADLAPLTAALRRWVWILLTAGAVGEMLVVGVVVLTVGRGLRPLRTLAGEIASIDQWGLERRVPAEGLPGEMAPVVSQLNGLLGRLEEAFDRERAFTASAAHEFRTPLAGIRTRLEVCLRRGREPEEYQATIGQCLDAAISLQRMVDSLLDLAKLDAGLASPPAETVDVPEMVRAHWTRLEPEAAAHGCSAAIDMPDPLEFRTDAGKLDHIVSNLLSNAAEYADPGSRIDIAVAREGGRLHLTVSNSARTLEAGDVAMLFDRFWRKDAARTNTGQHCGLGLAIVARCVAALGGRVEANLREGRLDMAVDLPDAGERAGE